MKCGCKVRRSGISGKGLFATRDFRPGDKIVEYTGTVYRDEDSPLNRYLVDLGRGFVLDGAAYTNTGRYANHSCKPNARLQIYRNKRVWIVASRRIKAGEEIAYNYGKGYRNEFIPRCSCPACG
jgi:SET domain-containing protein